MKASEKNKTRSGEQTRQRILSAASEVFSERGYVRSSVREVAGRAGISVGCVYLYFPNKQDLYTRLINVQMAEFLSVMEDLGEKPAEEALRALIQAYLDLAVKKTRMLSMSVKEFDLEFRKPLRSAFIRSQLKLIVKILEKGSRQKTFRKTDYEQTALMILSCLRGAVISYLTGEIKSPEKYGDYLYSFFLNGLRSSIHASKN